MSNYMTKAAAHARLIKLARAAHYIRRQRALQKYAQAVQMQKAALSTGAGAGIGALGGGLLGAGLGYGFGKKDKKLLSTLLGAGIGTGVGAGVGGLGGYLLNRGSSSSSSSSYPSYIEDVGKLVDEIPEDVEWEGEDIIDPEGDFNLPGKGWRMSVYKPGQGRYITNGKVTYFAPERVLRAGTDYRNQMAGGDPIAWPHRSYATTKRGPSMK